MDHTKIIGYCRVSTVEQADNGHSIDAQRAAIKAAAETRGWEILWVEDAASAKDLDRPGLSYALSMLGSGQAGGIVVSRLDRLSRSVHDLAILLKRARAEGWNVVMLDYGLDLSTPYGEFGATMLMAAAQLERDLISVRTKEGLAAAKAKGILPGPRRSTVPDEVIAADPRPRSPRARPWPRSPTSSPKITCRCRPEGGRLAADAGAPSAT